MAGTFVDEDLAHTVPNLCRWAARQFGDLEMLIEPAGVLTFEQAVERSGVLARKLLSRGYGKGSRIGLLLPNSADWVVAFLAVTRIGGMAILIPTLYRERELGWVLRQGDVDALFFVPGYLTNDYVQRLEAVAPTLTGKGSDAPLFDEAVPYLRDLFVMGGEAPSWASNLSQEEPAAGEALLVAAEAQVSPADPCFVMFTSGSSADPKAVVHGQGPLVRRSLINMAVKGYRRGERILSVGPFFWIGRFLPVIQSMHTGAAVVLPKSGDIDDVVAAVEAWRPSHLLAQDALRKKLQDVLTERGSPDLALGFAYKDAGGEPIPLHLHSYGIGMTETLGPHSQEPRGMLPQTKGGACGRVTPDFEWRIRDYQTGETLGPNQPGELCVRSPDMFQGFYRKERSEVFEPDGFYRTGDTCRIDEEGFLYFVGRSSEMIKTAGANVSPREVELLLEAYEGVHEAAVLGLPNGPNDEIVVAAVVPKEGMGLDPAALRARLRTDLATFKVPKHVWVMSAEEMPRGQTGKLNKRALREVLAARA